jgi:hypothetical protein
MDISLTEKCHEFSGTTSGAPSSYVYYEVKTGRVNASEDRTTNVIQS